MIAIRSKFIFLMLCLIETVWLLVAQVSGSMALIVSCLVVFLALAVFAATQKMAIPLLLFFMPFASLLKMRPGTISFFTIALLAVYLVYLIFESRNVHIVHIIPALALIVFCLAVKTAYGYSINNSFILFSASLLLVPFLSKEIGEKYDFYWLTLFFSFGIIIAAITSQYLVVFPTISRYIAEYELFGVVRHSGYYGDPNFYSAHVSAALGGTLVLLLNNNKKSTMVILLFASLALLYCGLLSVSKSYLLITVCLILIWFFEFLFQKGKMSAKIMLVLTLFVGIAFLLSTTVFTDLIDMMVSRLERDNSLSDFTTGRTDIWNKYFKAFTDDPLLMLFGRGFSKGDVFGKASHNTIIQSIFQFGIIGSTILLAWIVCYLQTFLQNVKIKWSKIAQISIIVIGAIGSWIALDFLFFDEFFLMPIYVCLGIRYLTVEETTD